MELNAPSLSYCDVNVMGSWELMCQGGGESHLWLNLIKSRSRHECLARELTHTGGTDTTLLHQSTRS